MSSDPIDALIDDTAKEMTAGSPSTALRDHVRARLMPRHAGWQAIWQPVLGAAAVAAIGLVMLWRFTVVPGVPMPVRFEPPPALEIVRAIDEPAVARVDRPVAERDAGAPQGRAAREVRLSALPDDINVAPLEIAPIPASSVAALERIAVPAPLQIEQLVIDELLSE